MVTLIKSPEVQEERPCLNSINKKIMMATTRMDKIMTLKVIPNEVLAIITRTIPIANSPIASKLYLLSLYLATL